MQAQLVHQEWQAGLGRLSRGLRDAHAELATGGQKEKRRIAALKEENRVLRKMVGWEEIGASAGASSSGSSGDDSDDEDGDGGAEADRLGQRGAGGFLDLRGRVGPGGAGGGLMYPS